MNKRDQFITDVVTMTNMLAKYYTDRSTELHKSYFDNGFDSSIDDAAVQAIYPDMTAADLQGAINLMAQINNLMGNATVTEADWLSSVNKVRISGLV